MSGESRRMDSSAGELKFGGGAIFVDDVVAVLDFYRRAFGFEVRFYDAEYEYGELDTGPARLGIASHGLGELMMRDKYRPGTAEHRSFGMEIAFTTKDVPTAFARAVEAGAEALVEPRNMPWGATVAYVRSIEGTLIVLSTPTDL